MVLTLEFQPEYEHLAYGESARLTFSAHMLAPAVEESGRSIVSLTSVLDKSGSMSGSKLDLVKRTTEFMMHQMSCNDKLGVVQYDSDVSELIKLSRTSPGFRHNARPVVASMKSGSCTNLSGGLFMGIKQQQDNVFYDWDEDAPSASSPSSLPSPPAPGAPTAPSPRTSSADDGNNNDDNHNPGNASADDAPQNAPGSGPQSQQIAADSIGEESAMEEEEEEQQQQQQQQQEIQEEEEEVHNMFDFQNMMANNIVQGPFDNIAQGAFDNIAQQIDGEEEDEDEPQQQQQQQQQSQNFFSRIATAFTRSPIAAPSSPRASSVNPRFVMQTSNICQARARPAQRQRSRASAPAPVSLYPGRRLPPPKPVDDDAVRCVFLFTDGLANEGITDASRLVNLERALLDKSPRVRVYTFGYGSDHSAQLLGSIAEAGSGTYYYIESEENIPTAFADALGGLLSVASQNVVVSFDPAPGVVVSEVHTNCATSPSGPDERGRTVSVGDLFSEEAKDILFDVEVPALDSPDERYLVGKMKITYLDVVDARSATDQIECYISRPGAVSESHRGGAVGISVQRARVMTGRALNRAREEADEGRYEAARDEITRTVASMQQVLQRSEEAGDDLAMGMTNMFVDDLNEALSNMRDAGTWVGRGSKVVSSKAMGHMQQRSTACRDEEDDDDNEDEGLAGAADENRSRSYSYANKQQVAMKKKAKAWFSK